MSPAYELPPPAGFGNCPRCAYFQAGPAYICHGCAAATFQVAQPYYCTACGQQILTATDSCTNRLCNDSARYYTFNRSIAMKTGALDRAIKNHKYDHKWGWGVIFARVLLGYLATTPEIAQSDLIIPMPAVPLPYGQTDRRGLDHTGWVIQSAQEQDVVGYPFRVDPPLLVKLQPTARMAESTGYGSRQRIAQDIYDMLEIRDLRAIQGRRIAVFDDVFTTGSTLNAVARKLREAGAREVIGVTLSRAPWRS